MRHGAVRFLGERAPKNPALPSFGPKRAGGYEFTSQLAPLSLRTFAGTGAGIIAKAARQCDEGLAVSLRRDCIGQKILRSDPFLRHTFPGFYANLIEGRGNRLSCGSDEDFSASWGKQGTQRLHCFQLHLSRPCVRHHRLVVIVMFTIFVRVLRSSSPTWGASSRRQQFLMFHDTFLLLWFWVVPARRSGMVRRDRVYWQAAFKELAPNLITAFRFSENFLWKLRSAALSGRWRS